MSNEAPARTDETRTQRGDVLALLRDAGPLPRIEIARRTGVSPTTITRTVNQLIDENVLVEGNSVSPSKLGRPATEVSINAESYYVVGVQIGIGSVQLGLVDVLGSTHDQHAFAYDIATPVHEVIATTAEAVSTLIESSPIDSRLVIGVGIAVPGPVDAAGRRILLPINLDWRDVPVADIMEPLIGLPVRVDHNVRSMALAEHRFGVAQDCESVAFVYLRTGLGAGLVVHGQPFSGGVHGAIELGHLQGVADGASCICGSTGCLETVLSERALREQATALGLDESDGNPLTAMWHAAETDKSAREAIDRIVAMLSHGLAAFVNMLNPELILLGGALAAVPDAFFERVTATTNRAVFPLLRPSVRIEPSSLGMDAGVLGGATSALERYFYV